MRGIRGMGVGYRVITIEREIGRNGSVTLIFGCGGVLWDGGGGYKRDGGGI